MNNLIVAKTIQTQIPNEVLRKVNARDYVGFEDGIQFRTRNHKKVVIKLNEMDTYDIEFWNVQMEPFVCEKVDEMGDIYNDQLGDCILSGVMEQ